MIPKRMAVLALCLLLVVVAFTGCLGGSGDEGGENGGENGGDTGDQAGDMILTEEDMPSGWYLFNWTEFYGYPYPGWEGDYGSYAITYFSDNVSAWDGESLLVIGVMDFDDIVAANSWYDLMKDSIEQTATTSSLNVGDEGFYLDETGDRSDVTMIFRNSDVCVMMMYSADTPLSQSEIIDFAELQNSKL